MTVSLPVPPPLENAGSNVRPSPPWVELLLRDTAGRLVYVDSRAEPGSVDAERTTWRYLVEPSEEHEALGVLAVQVTAPEGEVAAEPIRFEHIPMPDRRPPDRLDG